jgi:hypothetical protein
MKFLYVSLIRMKINLFLLEPIAEINISVILIIIVDLFDLRVKNIMLDSEKFNIKTWNILYPLK